MYSVPVSREEKVINKLNSVPELTEIAGTLFKTSDPVELTESETEYLVKCYKHCFPEYMVLQVCISLHWRRETKKRVKWKKILEAYAQKWAYVGRASVLQHR